MFDVKLHNVRFYDYNPQVIHCLAYSEDLQLLALSRSNNAIEIWNCVDKVFKQQELTGLNISSVEALVWCGKRLISAGLNGFILEIDIEKVQIVSRTSGTGGSIWCLALSAKKNILAAGTEEGFLCLFDTYDGILYNKILARQEGRILSIAWHPNGEKLVTGSVNYVHLFHVDKGQLLQFSVGGTTKGKETIIWCVSILQDGTIVTGDSRGKTSFWSENDGTLFDVIESHRAEILCMQVASDYKAVYVSGVDPVIVRINKVYVGKSKSKEIWVKGVCRRIHTHDVRAMVLTSQDRLFSGGCDTYLAQSYYPPKTAIKYPATPSVGYFSVSEVNSVLLGYENKLELWKLGVAGNVNGSNYFSIEKDRVNMLELQLKDGGKLEWCSLSPGAKYIAYVVNGNLKIVKITLSRVSDLPHVQKCVVDRENLCPLHEIHWLSDDLLLLSGRDGVIQVLSQSVNERWRVTSEVDIPDHKAVLLFATPVGSSMPKDAVACTDVSNRTHIINIDPARFTTQINGSVDIDSSAIVSLPRVKWKVSAIAIDTKNKRIFSAHSNLQFLEYCYGDNTFTKLNSCLRNIGPDWFKRSLPIVNVTYGGRDCIFVQDTSCLHVINRKHVDTQNEVERPRKQKKVEDLDSVEGGNAPLICEDIVSTFERANTVLWTTCLADDSLISIESNPIAVLEKLPPPFKEKKYGKS